MTPLILRLTTIFKRAMTFLVKEFLAFRISILDFYYPNPQILVTLNFIATIYYFISVVPDILCQITLFGFFEISIGKTEYQIEFVRFFFAPPSM